ncbi:hypothetical protein HYU06_03175 [Candidatus Woesearchaeota archaeon]|nr:hypothetical protein [Candidatus Woesearchaeota archaeon]
MLKKALKFFGKGKSKDKDAKPVNLYSAEIRYFNNLVAEFSKEYERMQKLIGNRQLAERYVYVLNSHPAIRNVMSWNKIDKKVFEADLKQFDKTLSADEVNLLWALHAKGFTFESFIEKYISLVNEEIRFYNSIRKAVRKGAVINVSRRIIMKPELKEAYNAIVDFSESLIDRLKPVMNLLKKMARKAAQPEKIKEFIALHNKYQILIDEINKDAAKLQQDVVDVKASSQNIIQLPRLNLVGKNAAAVLLACLSFLSGCMSQQITEPRSNVSSGVTEEVTQKKALSFDMKFSMDDKIFYGKVIPDTSEYGNAFLISDQDGTVIKDGFLSEQAIQFPVDGQIWLNLQQDGTYLSKDGTKLSVEYGNFIVIDIKSPIIHQIELKDNVLRPNLTMEVEPYLKRVEAFIDGQPSAEISQYDIENGRIHVYIDPGNNPSATAEIILEDNAGHITKWSHRFTKRGVRSNKIEYDGISGERVYRTFGNEVERLVTKLRQLYRLEVSFSVTDNPNIVNGSSMAGVNVTSGCFLHDGNETLNLGLGIIAHEFGHSLNYERFGIKGHSREFSGLYGKAMELGIINSFKDSNFVPYSDAGHPKTNWDELFASSFAIKTLFYDEYARRNYPTFTEEQKALAEEIFRFVTD